MVICYTSSTYCQNYDYYNDKVTRIVFYKSIWITFDRLSKTKSTSWTDLLRCVSQHGAFVAEIHWSVTDVDHVHRSVTKDAGIDWSVTDVSRVHRSVTKNAGIHWSVTNASHVHRSVTKDAGIHWSVTNVSRVHRSVTKDAGIHWSVTLDCAEH